MKTLLVALFIFFATINVSYGAVSWSGNTCNITGAASVAQINDCLTGAVNGIVAQGKTGEITVQLPADAETWPLNGIYIDMTTATYINVTSLIIRGAGTTPTGSAKGSASTGGTTITITTIKDQYYYGFVLNGSTSKKFRLTNISWIVPPDDNEDSRMFLIKLTGTMLVSSGGGFRIDHNTINTEARGRITYTYGRISGVVDHNYYRGERLNAFFGMFGSVNEGGTLGGNKSWYRGLGTNSANLNGWDNVFYEDNDAGNTTYTSAYTMFADCEHGGRVVIRYNTIRNMYLGGHGTGSQRSCISYVAYNNTMYLTDLNVGGANPPLDFRNGTTIAYKNTITETRGGVPVTNTSWQGPFILRDYRSAFNYCAASVESWNHGSPHDLDCDGSADSLARKICYNDLVSPKVCSVDSDCGTGAPANSCYKMDIGNLAATGYPCRDQVGYTSTGGVGAVQMTRYPSLFADNKRNGVYAPPVIPDYDYYSACVDAPSLNDDHIQIDRDYCHHESTLPTTCDLIPTTYVQHTYPHPLVGVGPVDTTNPTLSLMGPGGYQACSAPSDNYNIGGIAQDNVAVTGVKCCAAGLYCDSSTLYNDMDLVLLNTSGETWSKSETVACNTLNKTYYCRATDAAGNFSENKAIVFTTEPDIDSEAPTLSTYAIGADGRTLTLTFSEPVQVGTGGSTGFVLTNGDAETIPLTYISGANTNALVYQMETCVPSTDTFTAGLAYTQPIDGIEDLSGLDLASLTGADKKTVTNGSGMACNSTTSLFEHGVSAPSGTANFSGNPVNLGVKFKSTVAGTMTHCSFYKIVSDTGTHVCTVYRVLDGSAVGTVDFAGESESGWQTQAFASALDIAANEDYIVTVSHPTGYWTRTADFFASIYTNVNLTTTTSTTDFAGRYIYGASMAYPTVPSNRNYWVDFTMNYGDVKWQCTVSRTGDGCMVTGSQVVANGGTCSATVTLRNGWKATWGGTCVTSYPGSETGGIYATSAMSGDCALTAACTEQGILP